MLNPKTGYYKIMFYLTLILLSVLIILSIICYKNNMILKKLQLENNYLNLKISNEKSFSKIIFHNFQQPILSIKILLTIITKNINNNENLNKNIELLENINFNILEQQKNIEYYHLYSLDKNSENSKNEVEINDLFQQLNNKFNAIAESKGLRLHFKNTNEIIYQDIKYLDLILSNFIDNAIKNTISGGVWIVYRSQLQKFEVRDSGSGISVKDQEFIFKKSFESKNNGQGQGLFLVKKIADLANYEIGFNSSSNGSVFWVNLVPSD